MRIAHCADLHLSHRRYAAVTEAQRNQREQDVSDAWGACVDGIIAANPGRTVAAVCHGGTINAYLSAVLGLDRLMFFVPDYTSVSRVRAARSGPRSLVTLNETAHLRFANRAG